MWYVRSTFVLEMQHVALQMVEHEEFHKGGSQLERISPLTESVRGYRNYSK